MALIAALLPREADRSALGSASRDHEFIWASDWRSLNLIVKDRPAAAVVADLHAERGKDGALRVHRFSRRFPHTPILVCGEMDARDLFRLGKAGATNVLTRAEVANQELVAELLGAAAADRLIGEIERRVSSRLSAEGLALVRAAAGRIPAGLQVPDLAAGQGLSVSTLERRCVRWGLPTPGHLLLWLRVIYGLHWLTEPGRSVESVAAQLGYSSGAAFRRAIKVTIGGRPSPLRNRSGLDAAIEGFVAACPGVLEPAGGQE